MRLTVEYLLSAGFLQLALCAPYNFDAYMPQLQSLRPPPEMLYARSGPIRMQYAPLYGRQAQPELPAAQQQSAAPAQQQHTADLSPEEQAVYNELLKVNSLGDNNNNAEPVKISTPAQVETAGASASPAVMDKVGSQLNAAMRKTGFMVDSVSNAESPSSSSDSLQNQQAATTSSETAATDSTTAAAATENSSTEASVETTSAAAVQNESETTLAPALESHQQEEEASTTTTAVTSEATTLAPLPLSPSSKAAASAPLAMQQQQQPAVTIKIEMMNAASSQEENSAASTEATTTEESVASVQQSDAAPEIPSRSSSSSSSSGSAGLGTTSDDAANLQISSAEKQTQQQDAPAAAAGEGSVVGPPITASGPLAGVDVAQIFAGIDTHELEQPYSPPDKDSRIDEDVVMLPLIEEEKPGQDMEFDHRYPDENKQNVVESKKEIHTYSVQKKRYNVHKNILHRHHKVINVNTDYILNIHRVAHPHTLTETFESTQVRHQPFIYVKHTRTDKVNDNGEKAIEMPTVEDKQSATELPPIFDKPVVQRINYDENGGSPAVSVAAKTVERRSFTPSRKLPPAAMQRQQFFKTKAL